MQIDKARQMQLDTDMCAADSVVYIIRIALGKCLHCTYYITFIK